MNSVSVSSNVESATNYNNTHSNNVKSHWPTWALILVVFCIILSLLAFFLGNFITKRTTHARNKNVSRKQTADRERKWGAGFSGGLWAAA